jgi:integrase/recombinase XerD
LLLFVISASKEGNKAFIQKELEKLLAACEHQRDKAMIAVALDSSMRVGALGTLRIKSVVHNAYGAVLYISTTSRNIKSTKSQPVPLTWRKAPKKN